MKKFKEFVSSIKGIPAIIPTPIHFKYVKPAIIPTPIHFKHIKEEIVGLEKEKLKGIRAWEDKNDNKHLTKGAKPVGHDAHTKQDSLSSHISSKLRNDQSDKPETKEHIKTIEHYTDHSAHINGHLLFQHKKSQEPTKHLKHIEHLDHLTKTHKLKDDLHVYSGVSFHPGELTKHSNGVLKSPSFISTSHSKRVAHSFAHDNGSGGRHLLHIHLKKGDSAYHTTQHAILKGEHETILPRNTKLKIHPEPEVHYAHNRNGEKLAKVHIWHAEVDHS